jgi:hypothetical protein
MRFFTPSAPRQVNPAGIGVRVAGMAGRPDTTGDIGHEPGFPRHGAKFEVATPLRRQGKMEGWMIEGYEDLRDVLVELLGDQVTGGDVDVAVEAAINADRVTASAAISELVTLAQSTEGKVKIRDILAKRVVHERAASADRAKHAVDAINHLLAALHAERRTHAEAPGVERRH